MHKKLIHAMLVICCLLLAACLPAQAQFEKNLVINGAAELGPSSASGAVVSSLPGWSRTGNFTVASYNSGFADPGYALSTEQSA